MPLTLAGVTYAYVASKPVVENLNLDVAAGEALAIVAPSGSGKTTLLCLAGLLLKPQAGTVQIDGGDPYTTGAVADFRAQRIAWVFQTVNLLPRRSVLANAVLGARAKGQDADAVTARAVAVLGDMGLGEEFLDRRAVDLSGGEAQRVAVARALTCEPSVLIADEPTANLDRANADVVARALFGGRRGATSVLVATHDPVVAARADRVVTLADRALSENAETL